MLIGGVFTLIGIIIVMCVLKLVENMSALGKIETEREECIEAEDERMRLQDERNKIGHDAQTNPLLRILVLAVEQDGMDVAEDARYARELAKHGRRGGGD